MKLDFVAQPEIKVEIDDIASKIAAISQTTNGSDLGNLFSHSRTALDGSGISDYLSKCLLISGF